MIAESNIGKILLDCQQKYIRQVYRNTPKHISALNTNAEIDKFVKLILNKKENIYDY